MLDTAVKYAKEREQFGKPVIKNQALAHRVADLYTAIEAAQALTYQTAWRDIRIARIGGGTDEIMREIICTSLGL